MSGITIKSDDLSRLGARQVQVLKLLAQGLTNAQMAACLFISDKTVGSHMDKIREVLGIQTMGQVRVFAALKFGTYDVGGK